MDKLQAAKKAATISRRTAGNIVGLVLKIFGTAILLALVTAAMFVIILALYIRTTLDPQIDISLDGWAVPRTSFIMEMNHESGEYEEAIPIESGEVRIWVPFDEINPYLIQAAVAFEDRRFFEHRGVDWYRTAGAFYTMFFGSESAYGASTITQQLIKNLTRQDDVTVQRKILEIFRALELERQYSKEEILEWYLNVFALGGRIHGVGAAAQFYYGVDQSELTLAQSASIVGITQFPTRFNPYLNLEYNRQKRDDVLRVMHEQGMITHQQFIQAINEPIILDRADGRTYEMPIYSFSQEMVIRDVLRDLQEELDLSPTAAWNMLYHGGIRIYSAIDPRIQGALDDFFIDRERMPGSLPAGAQAAMVILDHNTGHVVGVAGGIGEKTINFGFNRAVDAQRPLGSAIKPISVFAPALELGAVRPMDRVVDAPIRLHGQNWPQNANRIWSNNEMNIVRALELSTNTIAVRVLQDVGVQNAFDIMTERLHINLHYADNDLAPLALGQLTHGMTVLETTAAFAPFANNGIFSHPTSYTRVVDAYGRILLDRSIAPQEVAFRADIANEMCAILLGAVNNGTGRVARIPNFDVAGKTGTSEGSLDRYFAGSTPLFTAAVWTGFDNNEGRLRGTNPAAVIFRDAFIDVHAAIGVSSARFENLPALVGTTERITPVYICEDSGFLATESCHNDMHGTRVAVFDGDPDDLPTVQCQLHVPITLCEVNYLQPNSSCPTVTRGILSALMPTIGVCTHDHAPVRYPCPHCGDVDCDDPHCGEVRPVCPHCGEQDCTDPDCGDAGYVPPPGPGGTPEPPEPVLSAALAHCCALQTTMCDTVAGVSPQRIESNNYLVKRSEDEKDEWFQGQAA